MAEYANNREQWPDGLWEEWGDPPPDEKRCQLPIGLREDRCGLPAYADSESGEPRCLFHYEGEDRDPEELQSALEAAIAKGANLWHANLQEAYLADANLQGARLLLANLQEAYLANANFQGADLRRANLQEAYLAGASTNLQGADLTGANLQEADLRYANLQEADLDYANLQRAILRWAQLRKAYLGGADLRHADLRRAQLQKAYLGRADLRHADLGGAVLREADLRVSDLRGVRLRGADIREAMLAATVWGRGNIIQDERDVRRMGDVEERYGALEACGDVYRQIMLSFHASGDYGRASDFLVRELECVRRRIPGLVSRLAWWLAYITSGYALLPSRVFLTMIVVLLGFALLHTYGGVIEVGTKMSYVFAPGIDWYASLHAWDRVWDAIYFSGVTFTGLAYGDMRPATDIGKMCAVVEAGLGVFLMALLVATTVRRFSR